MSEAAMNDLSWDRLVQHVHNASWAKLADEWWPLDIVYLCLAVGTAMALLVMRYSNKNVRGKLGRRTQVTDQDV
jgi:hypothetical protein